MPAIGVIPIPALANTTGRESSRTTSPNGSDMVSRSPTYTWSHRKFDTSPSGFPSPRTRLTENWRWSPSSALVRLYCRGCRTPSGIGTWTVTYWPGRRRAHEPVVGAPHPERHDVVGLLVPLGDLPLAPDRVRPDAAGAVQAALLVDQGVGHQPVDLVPRCGDLGRHRVAEDVDDRPEQVVVDDVVLLRRDAERGVLVGDAREQLLGQLLRHLHQRAGEDRHGAGEGHLLRSLGLVAAVEDAVEQLRVLAEEMRVEATRDLCDVVGHHRERGLDDGSGSVGKHVFSLPVDCAPPLAAVTFRSVFRYPFYSITSHTTFSGRVADVRTGSATTRSRPCRLAR